MIDARRFIDPADKHNDSRAARPGLKAGFTLLETLMAVMMISFGLLAAMLMQTRSIEGGALADRRTVAVFLAESRIDQITALTVAQMPDELSSGQVLVEDRLNRLGLVVPKGQRVDDGPLFTRRTIIRHGCPTSQSNEVEVEVSWPGAAQPLLFVSVYPAPQK